MGTTEIKAEVLSSKFIDADNCETSVQLSKSDDGTLQMIITIKDQDKPSVAILSKEAAQEFARECMEIIERL